MHSIIIQLSDQPIDDDEYINMYDIPNWFWHSVADCGGDPFPGDRGAALSAVRDAFGEDGITYDGETITFTDLDATLESSYGMYVKALKAALESGFYGFASMGNPVNSLMRTAYADEFGAYVMHGDELMPVNDFLRELRMASKNYANVSMTWHVGEVLDYHS